MAEWIIEHFPSHEIYVEVFGGAASVLMKKPPSKMEVINDIDQRIFNLYKSIRDQARELQSLLEMTPYSRDEYRHSQEPSADSLEDARRTIVSCYMSIGHGMTDKTVGFRNSKGSNTSPAAGFKTYVDSFMDFHFRMRGAIIENLDFMDCFEKYDGPNTLFYLDPPYVKDTRSHKNVYNHEMSNEEHLKLLNRLKFIKGKAVISGYQNPLYDGLGYKTISRESRTNGDSSRTECLWVCPKTELEQKQMSFL